MPAAVPSKPDHDVAYVTDVEGQWERLASFLEGNPLVTIDATDRIVVREGATFVFGGDAIDRGPHGRRIVHALLDVKLRQPDQVVLLGGNRDLNKLRLVRELAGDPPKRAPDDIKGAPLPTLLRWIFANTMGASDAFAHRQRELGFPDGDDDETAWKVAQSYLDDLAPDGELARYLEQCQLGWKSGRTLFVHGGVASEALSVVPGFDTLASLDKFDVDVWLARLDQFYGRQMEAFRARAIESDGTPAWEDAILYQAPRKGMRLNPGSVVYGRMGDEHNNPHLPAKPVVDALMRNGVRRVIVGHTPSGDIPAIVRTTNTHNEVPFEVVVADNSRSRVHTASRLVVRDHAMTIGGRTVLDDQRSVDVTLELAADDRASPIGRRTSDGSLVKAPSVVDDGHGWLLFRYDPGYAVRQRFIAHDQLGTLEDAVPTEVGPPPAGGL